MFKNTLNLMILLSLSGGLLAAQIPTLQGVEESQDDQELKAESHDIDDIHKIHDIQHIKKIHDPSIHDKEDVSKDDSDYERFLEDDRFNRNATRINGGKPVTQIVPYQISMQVYRRGRWNHFCGGSIISPTHVLTAAHCVDKMRVADISIVAGTLSWKLGGDRHKVTAKRIHPKFAMEPLIVNDIALLKVAPPFDLRKPSIATIALGSPSRVGEKVPVRLTGWGSVTATLSAALPEQLQGLRYRTISNEECARKGFRVTGGELCALSAKGQGACVGDSGGPLVTLQNVPQIVGIVSYGTATCAQGRPDVYTRVSSFLPYINRVITNEIP